MMIGFAFATVLHAARSRHKVRPRGNGCLHVARHRRFPVFHLPVPRTHPRERCAAAAVGASHQGVSVHAAGRHVLCLEHRGVDELGVDAALVHSVVGGELGDEGVVVGLHLCAAHAKTPGRGTDAIVHGHLTGTMHRGRQVP